jgi:hypothetical protein
MPLLEPLESGQAAQMGGRWISLKTADIANAPVNGTFGLPGFAPAITGWPHYTLSPEGPTGPTLGFALGLSSPNDAVAMIHDAPAAIAAAGGFVVTVYVLNPAGNCWFSMPAVSINYGELWETWDVSPCGLYFRVAAASVATPGTIYFHVMELS